MTKIVSLEYRYGDESPGCYSWEDMGVEERRLLQALLDVWGLPDADPPREMVLHIEHKED